MSDDRPIGSVNSVIGSLTVVREVVRRPPGVPAPAHRSTQGASG